MITDRNELERELLELCDRVALARARYEQLCRERDIVQAVNTLGRDQTFREAKIILSDVVREQANAQNQLWRQLVIDCADRILEMKP